MPPAQADTRAERISRNKETSFRYAFFTSRKSSSASRAVYGISVMALLQNKINLGKNSKKGKVNRTAGELFRIFPVPAKEKSSSKAAAKHP